MIINKTYKIYQFQNHLLPFIKALQLYNFDIEVYLDKEHILIGKDIGFVMNKKPTGIKFAPIASKVKRELEYADEFLDYSDYYLKNRNIYTNYDSIYNSHIYYRFKANNRIIKNIYHSIKENRNYMHSLRTPIIFVSNTNMLLEQEYFLMKIKRSLELEDVDVVIVSNKSRLQLLECYRYPSEVLNKTTKFSHKVLYLNNYIKAIEESLSPQVIILDLYEHYKPTNSFDKNFGDISYIAAKALSPDFVFMNISIPDISTKRLKILKNDSQSIFGKSAQLFNINNCVIEYQQRKNTIYYLEEDTIDRYIKQHNMNSNNELTSTTSNTFDEKLLNILK